MYFYNIILMFCLLLNLEYRSIFKPPKSPPKQKKPLNNSIEKHANLDLVNKMINGEHRRLKALLEHS